MLGVEFLHTAEVDLCNIGEKCGYLQVNIPDLMVGYVQGCSNTIFDIINDLLYDRKDLINEIPSNFIDEAKNKCNENNNIYIKGRILSGDFYFYLTCSYSYNYISKTDIPYLPPIPGPSESVKCKNNNKEDIVCFEGYCTFFSIIFNDTMKHMSFMKEFYGCPSEYFNYIYDFQQQYTLPKIFFQTLGSSCSQNSQIEKYDFYMENTLYIYQNCNPDINYIIDTMPQFPKLLEFNNNIYGECYYLVNGYLSNSDEDVGNTGTLCNSEHCVTLTINYEELNGIFMGCSSDLRQYLNVVNKKTSNLIDSKIEEYMNICNNGGTTSVTYDEIFSMTINCNNSVKPFEFKMIEDASVKNYTEESNVSNSLLNQKMYVNEEIKTNDCGKIFLFFGNFNIFFVIFVFLTI
uniref:SUEL-type lectin domain-containing protein n=1 Tax=Strongyloides papillosus TaxID=174720 RepID=A0A0N5CES8_STREA